LQTQIFRCQACGDPIEAKTFGPWPDYCSGKCRARAFRRRRRGLPITLAPTTRDGLTAAALRIKLGLEVK
jgi:hypothetical protein